MAAPPSASPSPVENQAAGAGKPQQQYNLTECLGFEYPPQPVSWLTRDVILYALSIGASKDDFSTIYEKDPQFTVFPTFPTCLSFKGEAVDVVDFEKRFGGGPKPPGLPTFDPKRLVQGSQFVEILKTIPTVSGSGWKVTKRVVGIHENAQGVTLDNEIKLVSPAGESYARLISQAVNLKAVANGVPFDKTIAVGIQPSVTHPAISGALKPKWVTRVKTQETASVLFRLNGDYNPLHIDPTVGEKLGYGGLICHGLGQYAFVAKSIVDKLGGGDPRALKRMYAAFSGPVTPGDSIQVRLWDLGRNAADGTNEIAFEARAASKNTVCLGEGLVHIQLSGTIPADPPSVLEPSASSSAAKADDPVDHSFGSSVNAYKASIAAVPAGLLTLVPGLGRGVKADRTGVLGKLKTAVALPFLPAALAMNVAWALGWKLLGFN